MDVSSRLDGTNLTVNGNLFTPKEYAKKSLFLRIRKRREDQPFDPNLRDRQGFPAILGKSPSKGDSNRRIVISKRIPVNALSIRVNK
jgi:hypothetical protein